MRKIITQWKFDKLFTKLDDGLGIKDDKGNLKFTYDENEEWLRRLDKLDKQYIVIGPRIIINWIRRKIHKYKLKTII